RRETFRGRHGAEGGITFGPSARHVCTELNQGGTLCELVSVYYRELLGSAGGLAALPPSTPVTQWTLCDTVSGMAPASATVSTVSTVSAPWESACNISPHLLIEASPTTAGLSRKPRAASARTPLRGVAASTNRHPRARRQRRGW